MNMAYRNSVQRDAQLYANAHLFLMNMRQYTGILTTSQFRDLRRQAVNGDVIGARKALAVILDRLEGEDGFEL